MRYGVFLAAASMAGLTGCSVITQGDANGVLVGHNAYATLESTYQLAQQYCAQFARHAVLQATISPEYTSYSCVPDQLPGAPMPLPRQQGGMPPAGIPAPSPPGPVSSGRLPPLPS